jgi:Neprosin
MAYWIRCFFALVVLSIVFLSTNACVVVLDPAAGSGSGAEHDGNSGNGGASAPGLLPEADNAQGEPWSLTPEQQARKTEAERYVLENVYRGYRIVRTVEDMHGDIIDWIASDSMEPLPYTPPELPFTAESLLLPEGIVLAENELERYPELFGPAGSTPFQRPMYWDYVLGETGAASIEEYLDVVQVPGEPVAAKRGYAGLVSEAPNRGLSGFMNQFAPRVEPGSFSLMEFAVTCAAREGEPAEELIGLVLSVDKVNGFGSRRGAHRDGQARLHVEYYRKGPDGKPDFVWDKNKPGFVPNPYSLYRLDSVVPVSTPGGEQVEHWVDIVQSPLGDWWIAYNGWFLGYYPGRLFKLLDKGACRANWYLEALDKKPGTAWVQTEMGTGKFPEEAGFGEAAWVRQPLYRDRDWVLREVALDERMVPEKLECYKRSELFDLGPAVGKVFLAGGPGGYSPLCTK